MRSLSSLLFRELAEYEKELDAVKITEAQLARDGFGPRPLFHALIADWNDGPRVTHCFATSTARWTGRQLFLEDLFVRPRFRGKGIGKSLMAKVAETARDEQCSAMRWEVLGWNQSAIDVYQSLGAEFLTAGDWMSFEENLLNVWQINRNDASAHHRARLAGCEAAWAVFSTRRRSQLVRDATSVSTPAHQTSDFAELVCSNSLNLDSEEPCTVALEEEMRRAGSLLIEIGARVLQYRQATHWPWIAQRFHRG